MFMVAMSARTRKLNFTLIFKRKIKRKILRVNLRVITDGCHEWETP